MPLLQIKQLFNQAKPRLIRVSVFVCVLAGLILANYKFNIFTTIFAATSSWTQTLTADFNYGQKDNITVSSDSYSLSSNFISSQLSGTTINDVYIYDTTADSSAADQVTLGVDPNWRNGVVKTTGTINTTDSGNIQVSVPDNDYTDGNTLEIKIVTGGDTGTAEYQWRVKDGSYSSSITTSTSLTQLGSTKVYVSFTTGTTFTLNDVFQIASWYTEQLDATELETCTIASDDRCGTREFPKVASLIATNNNLYIIDNEDNELWMKFQGGTDDVFASGCSVSSIYALNGQAYAGILTQDYGLYPIDFITDAAYRYHPNGRYTYGSNISNRHNNGNYTLTDAGLGIVNMYVNDVHAAVIDDSGTLKTYVAVATDGGVSVINETDGTVVDLTITISVKTYIDSIKLLSNGALYWIGEVAGGGGGEIAVLYSLPGSDTSGNYWDDVADVVYMSDAGLVFRNSGNTGQTLYVSGGNQYVDELFITSGTSTVDESSNTVYITNASGIGVLQEKQGDESNGSVKYCTKDYITEEMIGDIRGMWGFWDEDADSTLADGDNISDLSVSDTDMTVVDGGGTAPQIVDGVRGKAIQFDGTNDYLKQKVYEDETGANWGLAYHGLSLADGSAFARVDNVDLSTYASAANDYMLVVTDSSDADVAWGYIDTAGDGEATTGEKTVDNTAVSDWGTEANSTAGWTSLNSPTTFESSNVDTHDGSYSFHAVGGGNAKGFFRGGSSSTTTTGKLYKVGYWIKVISGSVSVQIRAGGDTTLYNFSSETDNSWQERAYYYIEENGGVGSWFRFIQAGSTNAEWYVDNVSWAEVTDVGTDGVHIMSTKGGSTQNWAGIDANFDYNDDNYTFEVRKTDFQITGDMTVGAWVKQDTWATVQAPLSKYNVSGSYPVIRIDTGTTAKRPRFSINGSGGSPTIASTSDVLTNGQWAQVVGVFVPSTSLTLYVNGAEVAQSTSGIPSNITDISDTFVTGALSGGGWYFNGTIDEPFITAEALSASQILTMFDTGCRAMGGTPGTGTCTGIDESSTTNKLAGSQNAVYGVGVDTATDPDVMFVGTSGSGTGALTKLQVNADKQLGSWTTSTTPALPANNVLGGVSLNSGANTIALGTDSGFSLLSDGYAGIGGLISGTSEGTAYGYDTGYAGTNISALTTTSAGSGTTTTYLRGGTNETMSTGLTPWYDVTSGTIPAGVSGKQYYQYKTLLEPSADGASVPTVSNILMTYESLPDAPSGLAASIRAATTITWSYTDNSSDEDEFHIKDTVPDTVCDTNAANVTTCQETGLTANTQYTRTVRASNGAGESADSNSVAAYTLPSDPTGLSVASGWSSGNGYYNTLSWNSGGAEASFKIYLGGDKDSGTLLDTISTGTTTYTHTSLDANTSYTYYVYAYGTDSDFSANYLTSTKTTSPGKVLGVAQDLSNTTKTAIKWTWNSVVAATGYKIYNAATAVINGVTVAADTLLVTLGDTTSWLQENLEADSVYQIYVRAINSSGEEGEKSNTVSATTDTTAPNTFSLRSPGDKDYTNNERPTFSWKPATILDTESGLDKYKLEVNLGSIDNDGSSNWLVIDNIPPSRTPSSGSGQASYETNKYKITYSNFDDDDASNNIIAVYTKHSTDWADNQNDGKLKEGNFKWKVKAVDRASNMVERSRWLYVDFTDPTLSNLSCDSCPTTNQYTNTSYQLTTSRNPSIKGTISDDKLPHKLEFYYYKQSFLLGIETSEQLYSLEQYTFENINNLTSVDFSYSPSSRLDYGKYRVLVKAFDKAGNTTEQNIYLNVVASLRAAGGEELTDADTDLDAEQITDSGDQEKSLVSLPDLEKKAEIRKKKQADNLAQLRQTISDAFTTTVSAIKNFTQTSFSTLAQVARPVASLWDTVATAYNSTVDAIDQSIATTKPIANDVSQAFIADMSAVFSNSAGVAKTIAIGTKDAALDTTATLALNTQKSLSNLAQVLPQSAQTLADTTLIQPYNYTSHKMLTWQEKVAAAIVKTSKEKQEERQVYVAVTTSFTNDMLAAAEHSVHIGMDVATIPADSQLARLAKAVNISTRTFYEVAFDKEPTRIFNVKVIEKGTDYAIVTWETNHLATSKANFGTTLDYGKDVFSKERVHQHKLTITGLKPGVRYFYEVMSENKNYAYDAHHEFETLSDIE